MSQTFELPPAAPNPPYIGGPYVGCVAAVAADFIAAYTGHVVTDLNALFASMTLRHRNVDPLCDHGLKPKGACGYCAFLELSARGLPVAYQPLGWATIRALLGKGQYVALAGLYSRVPTVTVGSYGPTVPARGRSDTYDGAHMVAGYGTADAGLETLIKDPDFGNWRGAPPYSVWSTAVAQSFFESLGYRTCYATKPPLSGASPSHHAVTTRPTALWNPVTRHWRYALKVGTALIVRGAVYTMGGKACHPVNGPSPYGGYFVPVANVRLTS